MYYRPLDYTGLRPRGEADKRRIEPSTSRNSARAGYSRKSAFFTTSVRPWDTVHNTLLSVACRYRLTFLHGAERQ
jgi:hypothetical protein